MTEASMINAPIAVRASRRPRSLHAKAFGRACGFAAVAFCLALPMALASRDADAMRYPVEARPDLSAPAASAFGAAAPLGRPEALRPARVCTTEAF